MPTGRRASVVVETDAPATRFRRHGVAGRWPRDDGCSAHRNHQAREKTARERCHLVAIHRFTVECVCHSATPALERGEGFEPPRMFCWVELNHRHTDEESVALPPELQPLPTLTLHRETSAPQPRRQTPKSVEWPAGTSLQVETHSGPLTARCMTLFTKSVG